MPCLRAADMNEVNQRPANPDRRSSENIHETQFEFSAWPGTSTIPPSNLKQPPAQATLQDSEFVVVSRMSNTDSDSTLPPPAYSEQAVEFDQKTSRALELSLEVVQNAEEEWEEWDEAAFEAASRAASTANRNSTDLWAGQLSTGSSSRHLDVYPPEKTGGLPVPAMLASVEPLRIHKRGRSSENPGSAHAHRSQLRDRINNESSPSSFLVNAQAGPSSQNKFVPNISYSTPATHHNIPLDDNEDYTIPPPPFALVEPSPDGTPVVIMTYDPSASPPPSPLNSPVTSYRPLPNPHANRHPFPNPGTQLNRPQTYLQQPITYTDGLSGRHRLPRQSLPTPPRPHNYSSGQRPITTYQPKLRQHPELPRIDFDPSIFYNKRIDVPESSPVQQQAQSFNASAFYNSAVSAHLSTPNIQPEKTYASMSNNSSQQHRNAYSQPSDYSTGYIQQPGHFRGPQTISSTVRGPGDLRPLPPSNPRYLNTPPSQYATYTSR